MGNITNENYIEKGLRIFDKNGVEITKDQKPINTTIPAGTILTLGKTDIALYVNLLHILKQTFGSTDEQKSMFVTTLKIFNTLYEKISFDYRTYFTCFNHMIEAINMLHWDLKHSHDFDPKDLPMYKVYEEWLLIQQNKFNNQKELNQLTEKEKPTSTIEILLNDIITAGNQLQGYQKNIQISEHSNRENAYNKQITMTLINLRHLAKDQSEHGQSGSGKSIGSPDIKIENEQGRTTCLIEGMILKSINQNNISSHLKKLFQYDPHILPDLFLVTYMETSKHKFSEMSNRYLKKIEEIKTIGELKKISIVPPFKLSLDQGIKVFTSKYRINSDSETNIHHVLINLALSQKTTANTT